jgi:hypothetical protein
MKTEATGSSRTSVPFCKTAPGSACGLNSKGLLSPHPTLGVIKSRYITSHPREPRLHIHHHESLKSRRFLIIFVSISSLMSEEYLETDHARSISVLCSGLYILCTRYDMIKYPENNQVHCQYLSLDEVVWFHIVTWRPKAGMVEPEHTYIAKQRLGNHVPAATNINERVVVR